MENLFKKIFIVLLSPLAFIMIFVASLVTGLYSAFDWWDNYVTEKDIFKQNDN